MNGLNGFRRRLATLSKRWWVFVQSALALVAVLLTTVFVTLLVGDKTSNLTRVLLGAAAVFVVGAHAWITATMDAVRDERFPLHPGLVLNMIRASSNSMSRTTSDLSLQVRRRLCGQSMQSPVLSCT